MSETTTVRPGQVWADRDWRYEGRTIRVERVDDAYAYCTVLTNSNDTQERLDTGHKTPWGSMETDKRGSETRLMLRRMCKSSTGWDLVQDVPA